MTCNDHVRMNVWCFHVIAPWQVCQSTDHKGQGYILFPYPCSLVLGRVQFSSNSADVTRLFWPVICDSRTATATSEQECFRGRAVTGTDPNRGNGDGDLPFHWDGWCWWGDISNLDKWGRDRTETGRGVGKVFVCGASRARPMACCIPWDQHHGVSFHPSSGGGPGLPTRCPLLPPYHGSSQFSSQETTFSVTALSLYTLLLLLS